MPNHVINELIFQADTNRQAEIRAALCGSGDKVDFRILVPCPANMWWGSANQNHEKAFGRIRLDWAKENWGTKWNAYSHHEIEATDSTIIFRFETAWRPPYPWLAAIFNTLKISFDHNWLSEGGGYGTHGVFDWSKTNGSIFDEPWTEVEAKDESDPLYVHLRELMYGKESL